MRSFQTKTHKCKKERQEPNQNRTKTKRDKLFVVFRIRWSKNSLIITFVICHVIGRGTFAVVEKCKYKNNIVAVKKLHSNLPLNVTNKMLTIYVAWFLLYLKLLF